jgi:hypothetical protein
LTTAAAALTRNAMPIKRVTAASKLDDSTVLVWKIGYRGDVYD